MKDIKNYILGKKLKISKRIQKLQNLKMSFFGALPIPFVALPNRLPFGNGSKYRPFLFSSLSGKVSILFYFLTFEHSKDWFTSSIFCICSVLVFWVKMSFPVFFWDKVPQDEMLIFVWILIDLDDSDFCTIRKVCKH